MISKETDPLFSSEESEYYSRDNVKFGSRDLVRKRLHNLKSRMGKLFRNRNVDKEPQFTNKAQIDSSDFTIDGWLSSPKSKYYAPEWSLYSEEGPRECQTTHSIYQEIFSRLEKMVLVGTPLDSAGNLRSSNSQCDNFKELTWQPRDLNEVNREMDHKKFLRLQKKKQFYLGVKEKLKERETTSKGCPLSSRANKNAFLSGAGAKSNKIVNLISNGMSQLGKASVRLVPSSKLASRRSKELLRSNYRLSKVIIPADSPPAPFYEQNSAFRIEDSTRCPENERLVQKVTDSTENLVSEIEQSSVNKTIFDLNNESDMCHREKKEHSNSLPLVQKVLLEWPNMSLFVDPVCEATEAGLGTVSLVLFLPEDVVFTYSVDDSPSQMGSSIPVISARRKGCLKQSSTLNSSSSVTNTPTRRLSNRKIVKKLGRLFSAFEYLMESDESDNFEAIRTVLVLFKTLFEELSEGLNITNYQEYIEIFVEGEHIGKSLVQILNTEVAYSERLNIIKEQLNLFWGEVPESLRNEVSISIRALEVYSQEILFLKQRTSEIEQKLSETISPLRKRALTSMYLHSELGKYYDMFFSKYYRDTVPIQEAEDDKVLHDAISKTAFDDSCNLQVTIFYGHMEIEMIQQIKQMLVSAEMLLNLNLQLRQEFEQLS